MLFPENPRQNSTVIVASFFSRIGGNLLQFNPTNYINALVPMKLQFNQFATPNADTNSRSNTVLRLRYTLVIMQGWFL